MHPNKTIDEQTKSHINTFVINTPVPLSCTEKGMKFLALLKDYKSDEVMRSKAIQNYIMFEWTDFDHKGKIRLFMADFILFFIL